VDIDAGEGIISIPADAKAIVACAIEPISRHENMIINKIDAESEHLNIYDDKIVDFICDFQNGVRAMDKELNVVQSSINLA
ncbi:aminoacyl-histidine dipeptidase, partial [Aliarcobacter butzleri]